MTPLKIAFLSFEYPPETGYGGIGTYTWYQARALVKLGHQVHVLAGANHATRVTRYTHDGVEVFRYRSGGLLMRGIRKLDLFQLWWTKNRLENAWNMYQAFQKLSKEHKYDLVEMPECGAEGMLINHLTGIPTMIRFHSPSRLIMPYYDVRKADIRFCSLAESVGIRGAKQLSSCSRFVANEVREQLGVRRDIRVIPNGIDLELLDAEEEVDIHERFSIPKDRLIIFFPGRMERRKGIHLCKEIVSSILERYEVAFVFAGQDLFRFMEDTLEPYIKTRKLKGSFHYLGMLNQTMIRACLRKAEIVLLPSLWENCPYSCLEAMALRCAVVSTDQGGMPELITTQNGQNGMLARKEDPASFISCLERLIEDQAFRERISSAARKTVEQSFKDCHIAKISSDYYLECLNHQLPEPVS